VERGEESPALWNRVLRRIAVGTPVAGCPPHRPGRAELPHPVPPLGVGVDVLGTAALLALGTAVTRLPGTESGTCSAVPSSPWVPSFPPLRPQSLPLPCSGASQVLRRYVTSRDRSSRAHGLGLSLAVRLVRQPDDHEISPFSRAELFVCMPVLSDPASPSGSRA